MRRGSAALIAVAATAALVYLLAAGGSDSDDERAGAGGVPEPVRGLVGGLSREEKVDQVLAVGFEGTDSSSPILSELAERQLGAVFVGPGNWTDAAQLTALLEAVRSAGSSDERVPPLVIADQEGGSFRAFPDLPPGRREISIAETGSADVARRWAEEAGRALREAGVDVNIGLVADVATLTNPLGDRTFGDDPELAAEMTAAAVQGCRVAAIACAPAHFPGLGLATGDTDLGPTSVGVDPSTLAARDLVPFEAAFREGAPAVLLSHAFYAAYDPVRAGSLSAAVATGLLRANLGFDGVAITDDLEAGAITAVTEVDDAAVEALRAGADLILIGSLEPAEEAREALLAAARSGEIPESRLDEAAGRVLELKRKLGLL